MKIIKGLNMVVKDGNKNDNDHIGVLLKFPWLEKIKDKMYQELESFIDWISDRIYVYDEDYMRLILQSIDIDKEAYRKIYSEALPIWSENNKLAQNKEDDRNLPYSDIIMQYHPEEDDIGIRMILSYVLLYPMIIKATVDFTIERAQLMNKVRIDAGELFQRIREIPHTQLNKEIKKEKRHFFQYKIDLIALIDKYKEELKVDLNNLIADCNEDFDATLIQSFKELKKLPDYKYDDIQKYIAVTDDIVNKYRLVDGKEGC